MARIKIDYQLRLFDVLATLSWSAYVAMSAYGATGAPIGNNLMYEHSYSLARTIACITTIIAWQSHRLREQAKMDQFIVDLREIHDIVSQQPGQLSEAQVRQLHPSNGHQR